jgi:hypothetical protein
MAAGAATRAASVSKSAIVSAMIPLRSGSAIRSRRREWISSSAANLARVPPFASGSKVQLRWKDRNGASVDVTSIRPGRFSNVSDPNLAQTGPSAIDCSVQYRSALRLVIRAVFHLLGLFRFIYIRVRLYTRGI